MTADTPISGITLSAVAERAEVTVQTVLRHFGSRDQLLAVAHDDFLAEVSQARAVPAGDVDEAVRVVVDHYERFGDAAMTVLAQEAMDATAAAAGDRGREFHDRWVRDSFLPVDERTHRLLAVATDVYTWKLLRRDRGLSVAQTQDHLRQLCRAIIDSTGGTNV